MKYFLSSLISIIAFSLTSANAEDLTSEITSGSYCKTEVYDRFRKVEKTQHEFLKFQPKRELMSLVEQMEIMCPWSVQRDFNGDKIEDWVGFTKNGTKVELIAYLSLGRNYSLQVINSLDKLPNNSFLRWMQTKYLKNFTNKKLNTGASQYALQVTNINDSTDISLWDGKGLSKVLTTPQMF